MDLDNATLKNLPGRTSLNCVDQINRIIPKFKNINLASDIQPPPNHPKRRQYNHQSSTNTTYSQAGNLDLGVPGALK